MLWIILCTDHAGQTARRAEYLQEHKQYLEQKKHLIFFSARQDSDDGESVLGSLFVLNTASRKGAEGFIHDEPFYKAGIFAEVSIRRIQKRHFDATLAE